MHLFAELGSTLFNFHPFCPSILRMNEYLNKYVVLIKQSKDSSRIRWILVWKVIYSIYGAAVLSRFVCASYLLYARTPIKESIFSLDPMIYTLVARLTLEHWLTLLHAPCWLMPLYLDYLFFYKFSRYILHYTNDLMKYNLEQTAQVFPELKLLNPNLLNLVPFIKNLRKLWRQTSQGSTNPPVYPMKLRMYPNVSGRVRARSAVMCLVGDVFVQLSLAWISLITVIGCLFWISLTYNRSPSPLFTVILVLDTPAAFYLFYNTMRLMLFVDHAGFNFTYIYVQHHKELKRDLRRALYQLELHQRLLAKVNPSREVQSDSKYHTRLAALLDHYWSENVAQIDAFVLFNSRIVSTGMLVMMGSNFLNNVYMLSKLMQVTLLPFQVAMYSVVLVTNVAVLIPNLTTMITFSNSMYMCEGELYRAQTEFRSTNNYGGNQFTDFRLRFMKVKLDLLTRYETIHTDSKIRFSIGYLVKVTQYTVFQSVIVYSSFFMYTFKLIRRNRHELVVAIEEFDD